MPSSKNFNSAFRYGIVAVSLFIIGYISSNYEIFKPVDISIDRGQTFYPPNPTSVKVADTTLCHNVLSRMTQGHWRTRKLSSSEHKAAEWFYHMALQQKGLPKTLQRPDGRCGDIGYSNVSEFIRAICNPTGPTPCCYNFRCAKRTEKQCRCRSCWDVRQQIHAEYSTWVSAVKNCAYRRFSARESCRLLDGGSVHFIGDSLIRHIYTGFLMTVRGNFKDGALRSSEAKIWKTRCSGNNMFEERNCRRRLDAIPKNICRKRLTLTWKKHYYSRRWEELIDDVTEGLAERRTLFVVGIGIHEDYNATRVQSTYLKPTLDRLRKIGILWPKLIFVDMNAPGIMKTTDRQSKPDVLRFNRDMEIFLRKYDIPVLKTFNLTEGVRSFDGTHYGIGVNVLKANIILNYIKELRDKGVW